MKTMLIGLCGKAGCGKDTAASYITQDFGFERYAFAYPLKQGLAAMLDVAPGLLEDRKYKEAVIPWLGKSPREMLQTLGTEWGREKVHPEIWLRLMERRYAMVVDLHLPGLVVTDVRFDNEAEKIRRMGGYVIQIERPGVATVATHVSENGINPRLIDQTIVNGGSLQALRDTVLGVVTYVRSGGVA